MPSGHGSILKPGITPPLPARRQTPVLSTSAAKRMPTARPSPPQRQGRRLHRHREAQSSVILLSSTVVTFPPRQSVALLPSLRTAYRLGGRWPRVPHPGPVVEAHGQTPGYGFAIVRRAEVPLRSSCWRHRFSLERRCLWRCFGRMCRRRFRRSERCFGCRWPLGWALRLVHRKDHRRSEM